MALAVLGSGRAHEPQAALLRESEEDEAKRGAAYCSRLLADLPQRKRPVWQLMMSAAILSRVELSFGLLFALGIHPFSRFVLLCIVPAAVLNIDVAFS